MIKMWLEKKEVNTIILQQLNSLSLVKLRVISETI